MKPRLFYLDDVRTPWQPTLDKFDVTTARTYEQAQRTILNEPSSTNLPSTAGLSTTTSARKTPKTTGIAS